MNRHILNATRPYRPSLTPLAMGGTSPSGVTLGMNDYYLEKNGKPWFPISGEFHFSRYPHQYWADELLSIKLAGIEIVSTYVFWIHHEEEEGRFDWRGDLDLRRFVELCAELDLYVILRIGPFAHGECRNGGLPDWLYGRPFEVRSNDPGYLKYVRRLYREIGRQVSGLLFKDGGPIIGIQLENEYTAASAKWEHTALQGDTWIPSGSGGVEHMRILKRLAIEAGFDVPLYACTAWGNAPVPEGELLPMWGGYAFQPWLLYWDETMTEHPPTDNYLFRDYHRNDPPCLDAAYAVDRYPFASCELGGGMQCWYNHRFIVPPESVEAMAVNRVAGGCNFLGYYMFHGGSNPIGRHAYLNERCVPKISYDFQAPLGEFGQVRESYRCLKPLHLFWRDFADLLCPMTTVLPDSAARIRPDEVETPRFAARVKDNSGFLFLTNYQDHAETKRHRGLQIVVRLADEELAIPARHGLTLEPGVSAILPFNLDLQGVRLKYATAQLMTRLLVDGEAHYFFFVPAGMCGEYCFAAGTVAGMEAQGGEVTELAGRYHVAVKPGTDCWLRLTTPAGKRVHIKTITREQALGFWKIDLWGATRALITGASVLARDGNLELRQIGDPRFSFSIFPDVPGTLAWRGTPLAKTADGAFSQYTTAMPPAEIRLEWRKVAPNKALVRVPEEAFRGEGELFLRLNYRGDIGHAFIDGRLIHDHFCNGQPWEIGLKRFYPEIAGKNIYLYVSPLRRGEIIARNMALAVKQEFIGDQIAEIDGIEVVPEYRLRIAGELRRGFTAPPS